MQIIGMRYFYLPIRMTNIKNTNTTKCWQECGETESFIHCWWAWKMVLLTLENSLAPSYRSKYATSTWPSNCLWAIPKRWKLTSTKTCQGCFKNSQDLETTHMLFNRWMVKHSVVHRYHRRLLSSKKCTFWELGWISGEFNLHEKANLKGLHTVWFHLYNILNMKKSIDMETDYWIQCEGVG